jgi:hypothetical protein
MPRPLSELIRLISQADVGVEPNPFSDAPPRSL